MEMFLFMIKPNAIFYLKIELRLYIYIYIYILVFIVLLKDTAGNVMIRVLTK